MTADKLVAARTLLARAALACVIAAKDVWITTDCGRPFGTLLDEASAGAPSAFDELRSVYEDELARA